MVPEAIVPLLRHLLRRPPRVPLARNESLKYRPVRVALVPPVRVIVAPGGDRGETGP